MLLRSRVAAIQLSDDVVRLLVVKAGGRFPRVLESHSCPVEPHSPEQRHAALVEAVKTVAGRVRNRPAVYVLCVSSEYSVVRAINIPFRKKRKVAAAVPFEIERYLAIPIEELVVDFLPVLEIEGQTEVLAVGIRRIVLKEQIDILKAAGIEPEGIDLDATGIAGLWRACQPGLKGLNALLYCGPAGSILTLTNNKALVYFRHLAFGSAQFNRNPSAVAQEILNSLRAFHASWKGGGEVASLAVAGVSLDADQRRSFEEEFDIPIVPVDLLGKIKGDTKGITGAGDSEIAVAGAVVAKTASTEPDWSALAWASESDTIPNETGSAPGLPPDAGMESPAFVEAGIAPPEKTAPVGGWETLIGVTLGATGGGYSMDFRKDEFAYKQAFSGLVPHIMLASALILVLLLGLVARYQFGIRQYTADKEELNTQVEQLRQEVEALQKEGINVDSDFFTEPTFLDVLKEIATRMPDEQATINDMRLDPVGENAPWIVIRGNVKNDAGFKQAFEQLKQSKLFKVDDDAGLKMEEGKSTFRITVRKAGGAGAK